MKNLPFIKETDADGDLLFKTIYQGTKIKKESKIYPHYETILGFNPLTATFIPSKSSCQCTSFRMKRIADPEASCKHLMDFVIILEKYPEEKE